MSHLRRTITPVCRDHSSMGSANERGCHNVTWSLIGWAHPQKDHWSGGAPFSWGLFHCSFAYCNWSYGRYVNRDYFVYAPSEWDTTLQCNVNSHWLVACLKWSMVNIGLGDDKLLTPIWKHCMAWLSHSDLAQYIHS